MRKIPVIFILIYFFGGISFAQSNFKPSFQAVIKGGISFPLGDGYFKNSFGAFPTALAEIGCNVTSHLQAYGNVSYDMISSKVSSEFGHGLIEYLNSKQLSFSIGTKFYIRIPEKKVRFFGDVGVGFYSFSPGDTVYEEEVPGNIELTISNSSYSQFGVNFGGGSEFFIGRKLFLNFSLKYHYIFKKNNIEAVRNLTYRTSGELNQSIEYVFNAPGRKYIQFSAGLGYTF